jgi:glycosyltransferase involved in cell wall biosynthesis
MGTRHSVVSEPKPLKVAYVTMRYPLPSETFATLDVRALSEAGVDLTVFALRPGGSGEALLRDRGVDHVTVVRSEALSYLGWALLWRAPGRIGRVAGELFRLSWRRPMALAAGARLLPASLGAALRILEEDYDVVHLRWGHHPAVVGAIVYRWASRRVVISHSLSAYDLEMELPVSRWLALRADVVRTNAQANLSALAERYGRAPDRVDVIVDGVADEVLDAPSEEKEQGLVVTAGRLIASKRTHDVLRAFALAAEGLPEARLEVFGDGPERPPLERLAATLGIADRTRFRGMVPHAEVVATMRRASAFVFLSDKSSERLPNVVKEAQAGVCPVVATTTPGIGELVQDGHSGFLIAPKDVVGAGRRLRQLLLDPDLAAALGARGRDHVRSRFRLSESAAAYVAAWRRALERAPSVER